VIITSSAENRESLPGRDRVADPPLVPPHARSESTTVASWETAVIAVTGGGVVLDADATAPIFCQGLLAASHIRSAHLCKSEKQAQSHVFGVQECLPPC
jgi:hypothetical protein